MRKFILMTVCAIAVSSVFCSPVLAQDEMHDGFFFRLAPGFGKMFSTVKADGDKTEWSGLSGHFNIGIGGAVSENFILHLDASGVSSSDPKVEFNGHEQTVTDTTLSAALVGVGMTYYFPSNFYVTGAVGLAESRTKSHGVEDKSDTGYGVNLMLGKEWWVSGNWGLGLAGQFLYTTCPYKVGGLKPDINTTSFGLLLTATYN